MAKKVKRSRQVPGSVMARDEPTPNGGVRSVAYFSNKAGKPTHKDKATRVEIVELDENDEVVYRTYGTIG